MTNKISRRTIAAGAWTIPVLAVSAPAPAFAASALICSPTAECKQPGDGSNDKDYRIRTNCLSTGGAIVSVSVRDKHEAWVPAADQGDGTWLASGLDDSRRSRMVQITDGSGQVSETIIDFPPC